ncbi:retrovirus-related pol polyprotein from transposon tnt 1-94, partial [Nicotiana attenuata]
FSDVDWAGCAITRRSTTGLCVILGANCISWSLKKQHTVAKSSAEAEYRALAALAAEVTWIVHLLHHVGVLLASPPVLYSDNISALHLSSNPILHARTKHVKLDYHFIREKVTSGAMVTKYVPSLNQVADIFTKALTKQQYQFLRSKLGVVS